VSASLDEILAALTSFAPLALAEPWDNVGLLLPGEGGATSVERALFAIDLTEAVLDEAVDLEAELVVAYHPPLFEGIKRVDLATPAGRIVARALRHGIAVFSPHTSLDAVKGGINDWLADGVGDGDRRPLEQKVGAAEGVGMGRLVSLDPPRALELIVSDLKAHLGKRHLRVAPSRRHAAGEPIGEVAICAGAGGSMFSKLGDVDLLFTGEMRHHDVLLRIERGTSVVLAEHTGSERGYLPAYAREIEHRLAGRIETVVSRVDRDPLEVV
jgi:dinuclear metal center YbgI/SA1388 family protein